MALENRPGGGVTYVNTFNGHFTVKCKENEPGAVSRTNKNGKTVWELTFTHLTGILTEIKKRESEEFGWQWEIKIVDDRDYIIQIPYGGGMPAGLFARLLQKDLDLSKPIQIGITSNEKDGKTRTYFFVKTDLVQAGDHHNGTLVKPVWNKENPGNLPDLVKIKVKGKEQWDDSERMEYIEKLVIKHVVPKLKNLGTSSLVDDIDEPAPSANNASNFGAKSQQKAPKNAPAPANDAAPDLTKDDELPF
ncbi:MAG TPA: hypothetical protein VMU29_12115 [Smithella sp.]|nr:hypothetical protein [Smithella sp.]